MSIKKSRNKRDFFNKKLLQYFDETALYSFEDKQEVFNYSDPKFDIETKSWLRDITNSIRTCAYDALQECINPSSRAPELGVPRRSFTLKSQEDKKGIFSGGLALLNAKKNDAPHPWYIEECLSLIRETENLQKLLDSQDYKRAMNFSIIPLLRHAQLVEHANVEFGRAKEKIIATKEAHSNSSKNAAKARWQPLNEEIEFFKMKAKALWEDDKYLNFHHADMANHLLKICDDDGRKHFPLMTKNSAIKATKEVAMEIGKRILGGKLS